MERKNSEYCNACIDALLWANTGLTQTSVDQLLKRVRYGKADTYGFDAAAEIQIKDRLLDFDGRSALVTEELGQSLLERWPAFFDFENHPALFLCDPADRSDFLVNYLNFLKLKNPKSGRRKFGEFVAGKNALAWEKISDAPASITGATAAISCVRHGQVMCSVLLNYITQEVTIASPEGIKCLKLGGYRELKGHFPKYDEIMYDGATIEFPPVHPSSPWDNFKYFTTFMGNERKKVYPSNIRDSDVLTDRETKKFARYKEPGGPARILYLSSRQPKDQPMGFVMANGEKITEWIHWLPFIRFSHRGDGKALRLFEVFQDRPWTKDGILMATSETYSVFQASNGRMAFDVNFLRRFSNPSKYRSTLIVAPSNNEWISQLAQQKRYREIVFA